MFVGLCFANCESTRVTRIEVDTETHMCVALCTIDNGWIKDMEARNTT